MQIIDAHLHLWSLSTPGHRWPTKTCGTLYRDFGLHNLAEVTANVPLAAAVLVQSQPSDFDTDWILDVAASSPLVAAVVGWADLLAPDAPQRIAQLARHPKLRGLRPMLHWITDTHWLNREELTPALSAMQDCGLRLDALVEPRHLPMLARFAKRWPGIPIVIDHGAKPRVAAGEIEPWRSELAVLADCGAYCKLSGLRTEQAAGQSADGLHSYVDHLVGCFGRRLMWGSDWPILLLSGSSYGDWFADADRITGFNGSARDCLFGGAAHSFYGIGD